MIRAALVEVRAKGAPKMLGPLVEGLDDTTGAPPVAHVILDRPARRNALDTEACLGLANAIEAAALTSARSIVVTGSGGHFCAGADLNTVEDDDFQPALRRCLQSLVDSPIPVVLGIEGACLGAGMQLAIAADLRVIDLKARLGIPAAKLGLSVDHWTIARAVQLVGRSAAAHLLLTAEEITGFRAWELGFSHKVGTPSDALQLAASLSALAPLTLRAHKLGLEAPAPPSMAPEAQDPTVAVARASAWGSADLAEGKRAFAEKRKPVFRGE